MATFDCVVDTKPMADSVANVSNHIDTTTAAVTAMQESVIKTEQDAADHICKNVDIGFFSLIRSQVSMKLAKYYTDMNAKLLLLTQFTKSLMSTQMRMETDVNRLKREYYKTFQGLDKSLENRINELDKNAVQLAQMRKSLITTRMLKDTSSVICISKESQVTSQKVLAARIKNKTSRALSCVSNNVWENQQYKNQLKMLLESRQVEKKADSFIPILCVREQSMVMKDSMLTHMYFPTFLSKSSQNIIESRLMDDSDTVLNKEKSEKEISEIQKEFYKLVSDSNMNDRTQQVIHSLFENGRI